MCRRTALGCSGCALRPGWPGRSPSGRCRSSARGGRRARSAGCRSTPAGTSAHGRMATGPAVPDRPPGRRTGRGQRAGPAPGQEPAVPDRPPGRRTGRGQRAGPAPGQEPVGQDAAETAAIELLSLGTIEVEGRLVVASNATLYCTVRHAGREAACVYKPVAGERPLWDFPSGSLAGREVAAYQVSTAAGWHLVPPTVFRDGPFGPGMCQLWIESDETVDVIALARSSDHAALRDMAV